MNLDYLHYLRQALLNPLQKHGAEGAGQAVQLLDDYQLIKEDVDSIMEISVWGGQPDPYSRLDSKVSSLLEISPFLSSLMQVVPVMDLALLILVRYSCLTL